MLGHLTPGMQLIMLLPSGKLAVTTKALTNYAKTSAAVKEVKALADRMSKLTDIYGGTIL